MTSAFIRWNVISDKMQTKNEPPYIYPFKFHNINRQLDRTLHLNGYFIWSKLHACEMLVHAVATRRRRTEERSRKKETHTGQIKECLVLELGTSRCRRSSSLGLCISSLCCNQSKVSFLLRPLLLFVIGSLKASILFDLLNLKLSDRKFSIKNIHTKSNERIFPFGHSDQYISDEPWSDFVSHQNDGKRPFLFRRKFF